MREAVGTREASNRSKADPRDELKAYLDAPLEVTEDVIGWWGVSRSSLIQELEIDRFVEAPAPIPGAGLHGP